jgi:hypothetical protein
MQKPAAKPAPKKKAPPSGKAGNYRAPVDTAGMDREMKETLGFGKKRKGK